MKYNRSEIMKRAGELRAKYGKKYGLIIAWMEAKVNAERAMITEGTRIVNKGDIANAEKHGYISEAISDKWGDFFMIKYDDNSESKIPCHMINSVDSGNYSTRFVTMKAYMERHLDQTVKFLDLYYKKSA